MKNLELLWKKAKLSNNELLNVKGGDGETDKDDGDVIHWLGGDKTDNDNTTNNNDESIVIVPPIPLVIQP